MGYHFCGACEISVRRMWLAHQIIGAVVMEKGGYVYILASRKQGTLYVGVTADIGRRVHEHRSGSFAGFTKDYGVKLLVWYEHYAEIGPAIAREKQLKRWNRAWKIALIEADNADWDDLAVAQFGWPPLRFTDSDALLSAAARHCRESGDSLPEAAGDGSPLSRG